MLKNDIITHLHAAKVAHVSWVQKAKLLIEGIEVDEKSIPVNSTECKFGMWFYSDAQRLRAMPNCSDESMSDMEELHFQLHDIYLKIFKLYYSKEDIGFFRKLFGKKRVVSNVEKDFAKKYFDEMEQVSKKLLQEINRMERRINAINAEKFSSI